MPYVPPLQDDQVPEAARGMLQAIEQQLGSVPNIFRTMAHQPAVLEAMLKMNGAVGHDLPELLRELAYLKASLVNQCHY